jgi:membrane-associated phospholipid phosphatase
MVLALAMACCVQAQRLEAGQGMSQPHDWPRFVVNTTVSAGMAFGVKTILKSLVNEERPDHSDDHSFPSGHAALAFAVARSIDKEFRRESVWIPIVGYATATAIGVERVVSDRHHWYDVVAGAGIGLASAELTWWLSGKLFPKKDVTIGLSPCSLDVAVKL